MYKKVLWLLLFAIVCSYSQITPLKIVESAPFKDKSKDAKVVAIHASSNMEKGIVDFSKTDITFQVFGQGKLILSFLEF